jgi:hypothetical protein
MANTKDFRAKNRVTTDVLHEVVASVTPSSGAATVDMATASVFTMTITEDTEVTFTNPPASGEVGLVTLVVTADTGSYTLYYSDYVTFDEERYPINASTWVLVFRTIDGGETYQGTYGIKAAA